MSHILLYINSGKSFLKCLKYASLDLYFLYYYSDELRTNSASLDWYAKIKDKRFFRMKLRAVLFRMDQNRTMRSSRCENKEEVIKIIETKRKIYTKALHLKIYREHKCTEDRNVQFTGSWQKNFNR